MTSIADLTAVSVLAKACNFRAAAEILGVSTSSLSRTIANIENEVGARLFNRTTRSVSLTDAGRLFLLKVEPALIDIESAIAELRDIKLKHVGKIRINADEAVARQIVEPIIAKYLKQYPDMEIELICDGRLVDIVSDGFDAGIRSINNIPKDMVAIPIKTNRKMTVVASPEYLDQYSAPMMPNDLLHHDCIRERYPSGRKFKWEFQKGHDSFSIDVPGRLTVNSYSLVLDACLAGTGIGYTSYHFAKEYIQAGLLREVLADWMPDWPELCLYYPQARNMTSSLRAFIDIIKGN